MISSRMLNHAMSDLQDTFQLAIRNILDGSDGSLAIKGNKMQFLFSHNSYLAISTMANSKDNISGISSPVTLPSSAVITPSITKPLSVFLNL